MFAIMNITLYQVDAFTNRLFGGNPASVCPLEEWLDDASLQNIAAENNQADTAFYIKNGDEFSIRWFTPTVEVALCGHATLATAHVLFYHQGYKREVINFSSKSGLLVVRQEGEWLTMDFPADEVEEVTMNNDIVSCFNIAPQKAFKGKTDYLFLFSDEEEVANLKPDLKMIALLPCRGVIATAKGDDVDFVSRFFAPQSGINEDAVTGSAHTTLTPFWSRKLEKKTVNAVQLSKRRGILKCTYTGSRVEISGQAKTYLVGKLLL